MEKINVLFIEINNKGGSYFSLVDMIKSLGDSIHPIVLFPWKNDAYHELHSMGVECLAIHYTRTLLNCSFWGYLYSLPRYSYSYFVSDRRCVQRVVDYFKGRKVHVVHTNTSDPIVGVDLARKLNAKHVWHTREQIDLVNHILWGTCWLRRKKNHADARILISQPLIESWGLKKDNTFVIGNAVRSINDAMIDENKDKYILFCSASLSKRKGVDFLVEAFAMSQLWKSGYQLYLIGKCDEEMNKLLHVITEKYNITEHVKYLGKIDDIKPYYMKASLYVMASESEGLSRTAIEAMFYGCPVLAHMVGGTTDFIFEGETGYFYQNMNECVAKMKQIVSEDQNSVIQKAQQYVMDHYSIENYGSKILDVYQKVLKV